MRTSLIALLSVVLVAACSQAPVQPAPVTAPPPAATQTTPAPAPVVPPPVQPPAPATPPPVQEVPVDKDHREVLIHTNLGDMVVQLDATQAPNTVKQFLTYVKEHYFDGSGFYRVIPGFVIQGGDYTPDLDYHTPKHKPIAFEPSGLTNQRGSIAMARDENPDSANSTFFINLLDNTQRLGPRPGSPGYAVFGQVVKGMDVVDKIATVETGTEIMNDAGHARFDDVPKQPVNILKVTLLPLPGTTKP